MLALLAFAGCGGGSAEGAPPASSPAARREVAPVEDGPIEAAPIEAHLPEEAGAFVSSLARIERAPAPDRLAAQASVERCVPCHRDTVEAFRSSAHAHASFSNPWYRQSVRAFREEVGHEESRFCAGCHDPLLLATGAIDRPIDPSSPLAYAGVTCVVCHGIEEARADGSASYTLDLEDKPLPTPADPASIEAHRRAFAPAPLRRAALCGSCHRGSLGPEMGNPHHLAGIDDLSPWLVSGYAGQRAARIDAPVEARDCRGCHMPGVPVTEGDRAASEGRIASHRFAGAHTAMAASLEPSPNGDRARPQLEATQALLRSAARLDLAALYPADGAEGEGELSPGDPAGSALPLPPAGAPIRAGARLLLDVVIRNEGVGHHFPGGTRDAQDTWLEVELRDAEGRLLLAAGDRQEAEEDPSAAQLRALAVDAEGRPSRLHRVQSFHGVVADATIAPRDAQVVRYAFTPPGEGPYLLRARLRHRRHERIFQEAACAEERSAEGAPFQRPGGPSACAPGPITELAEARAWIGRGSAARAAADPAPLPSAARRLFALGLGLGGQLQERLGEAEAPLLAGLRLAREEGEPGALPLLLAQLARVRGQQGRLEEALRWADEAQALAGPHPALDRLRGQAYAQVWRWPEAAEAFDRAAALAPGDLRLWAALAQARGSAGRDRASLEATRRGLLLWPRDEPLLRSQALALRALERPEAEAAQEAYLAQRSPDALSALRFRCAREVPGCARLQLPVRTIAMRSPNREGGGVAADRRRSANSRP